MRIQWDNAVNTIETALALRYSRNGASGWHFDFVGSTCNFWEGNEASEAPQPGWEGHLLPQGRERPPAFPGPHSTLQTDQGQCDGDRGDPGCASPSPKACPTFLSSSRLQTSCGLGSPGWSFLPFSST